MAWERRKAARIKRSSLAGTWYPAGEDRLRSQVDAFLSEGKPGALPGVLGLIVPHAGYVYSGAVAGLGYQQLRDEPCERVVILAPSHRIAFRGVAVLEADAFETPLGVVPIDSVPDVRSALLRADPAPFEGEHSLEIQLPFLQRVRPGAAVVPFLFGDLEPGDYAAVAGVLGRLADSRTKFVVSSDFTHYGWSFGYVPFPPENAEEVRRRLRDLDMGAIRAVLDADADAFRNYVEVTGDTICGRIPIGAFLEWIGPEHPGALLGYRTSLDVTGDYDHTVSYAAIAFPRRPAP